MKAASQTVCQGREPCMRWYERPWGCHFGSSPDLRSQLILPSLRCGFHVFTLQGRMALFSLVSYFRFVMFHSFHNATGTGMQESNTFRPINGPGLRLVFSRGIFFSFFFFPHSPSALYLSCVLCTWSQRSRRERISSTAFLCWGISRVTIHFIYGWSNLNSRGDWGTYWGHVLQTRSDAYESSICVHWWSWKGYTENGNRGQRMHALARAGSGVMLTPVGWIWCTGQHTRDLRESGMRQPPSWKKYARGPLSQKIDT